MNVCDRCGKWIPDKDINCLDVVINKQLIYNYKLCGECFNHIVKFIEKEME